MNILHVVDFVGPQGGTYQFLVRLHNALDNSGITQQYVAVEQAPFEVKKKDDELNIKTIKKNGLRKYVRKIKPDIIHFHERVNDSEYVYCLENYKTVRTVHGLSFFCPNALTRNSRACGEKFSEKCIDFGCIDKTTYDSFRETEKLNAKLGCITYLSRSTKKLLIQQGYTNISENIFPTFLNHQPDSAPSLDLTILFVGRMIPQKGVAELIKAVAQLRLNTWKLYLVGTGDKLHVAQISRDIYSHGLNKNIKFFGHVSQQELKHIYLKSRVAVFPSVSHETYGYAGAEAMSYGIPVIASSVYGVEEWLEDGYNGVLVEPGNINELTNVIEKMLVDDNYFNAIRRNAAEKSRQISLTKQNKAAQLFYQSFLRGSH